MFKSIVLATAVLFSGMAVAQHHGRGGDNRHNDGYYNGGLHIRGDHAPYGGPSRFYRFNQPNGGHFVHSGGYYGGYPYYGGLSLYNGVNIYPCTQLDFVNGYCYPYDYSYYPQRYSGFSVGINIR